MALGLLSRWQRISRWFGLELIGQCNSKIVSQYSNNIWSHNTFFLSHHIICLNSLYYLPIFLHQVEVEKCEQFIFRQHSYYRNEELVRRFNLGSHSSCGRALASRMPAYSTLTFSLFNKRILFLLCFWSSSISTHGQNALIA